MVKHDGWVVKISISKPFLHAFLFAQTRTELVKKFEKLIDEPWSKYRRRGTHKIVKVKLVEVDNITVYKRLGGE